MSMSAPRSSAGKHHAADAAAKTQELGGTVAAPAFDAPGLGRISVLKDGHGTTFAVMAPETVEE